MKKFISAVLTAVFICTIAMSASAVISPMAPTIETTRTPDTTTTKPLSPITETTTKNPLSPTGETTRPSSNNTTAAGGTTVAVDNNATKPGETTTDDKGISATKDTNPSSPDTGAGNTVSKAVAASIFAVASLTAAGAYISKKKIAE